MKQPNASVLLITLMIGITSAMSCQAQKNEEKAFTQIIELLSQHKELVDYKDRLVTSGDYKNKLIVAMPSEASPIQSKVETDNFVIAPLAEIEKADVKFFVKTGKTSFTEDSCTVEFEVVNKYDMKIKGNFTLIPNTRGLYDFKNYKTRSSITRQSK